MAAIYSRPGKTLRVIDFDRRSEKESLEYSIGICGDIFVDAASIFASNTFEAAGDLMCGLNGAIAYHPSAPFPRDSEIMATREAMRARGPDGAGFWRSEDARCVLAHRRLAIIDLSERAAQPMLSACGTLSIVFNGEIYNYKELSAELEAVGTVFATTSDTEVILHLYRLYGERMVERLRGMFAFAIYDETRHGLLLARDPYGIKPLYISNDGWTLRFASQVKALLAGGAVSLAPEPAGIVGFHLFGSVPDPFTLYRDIRAVPAGHTQWADRSGVGEPRRYHNIAAVLQPRSAFAPPLATAMRDAFLASVRAHLVSDVDVGVFLSAGVDSGSLLGLMADAGARRVKAITLGFAEFEGSENDEAPLARQVAAAYGAEHIIRRVDCVEFEADMPALLERMDQPSIDGVNTWFVAKAAREAGLKVALSGLGGDELLAGYPSFRDIPRWVARLRLLSMMPGLGQGLRRLATGLKMSRRSPKSAGLLEYGGSYAGAYLLRRGLFLPFELEHILDPHLVADGLRRLDPIGMLRSTLQPDPGSPNGRVTTLESSHYMRHQLLRDADWAGMAHGVEIRTPFVDATLLAEVASMIPVLAPGAGKRALAATPTNPLPAAIVDRPKTGFGVPVRHWIAEPARRGDSGLRSSAGLVSRSWARRVFASHESATLADAPSSAA